MEDKCVNSMGAELGSVGATLAGTARPLGFTEDWESPGVEHRTWQVVLSTVGMLLLSPLCLAIAVAIKLTSRGPVFYKGKRIGKGATVFEILKFRTLEMNAESKIGRRLLRVSDRFYTPIGRFLKRSKLDEIPQLVNVLRGEMNLVGPRPVRPIFLGTLAKEIPGYWRRFAVSPGLTGLAQLRGGYHTHPRNKLRYDLLYIHNQTLWLDLRLFLGTFVKLLNKWLTFGVLLGLLFLSASLVPGLFHAPFQVEVGGFRISPFEMVLLILAVVLVVKSFPGHKFYIYRCPLNLPIACFLGYALLSALVSVDPMAALQGVTYLGVTGFALAFLIIHQGMNTRLVRQVVTMVAISAAVVSSVGLAEVILGSHAQGTAFAGLSGAMGQGYPRIGSTLENPVVLSAFLVLGIPLLFSEVLTSRSQAARDFWLVASTVAVIALFLTQTRVGMIALFATVSIFLWRVSRRFLALFAILFFAFVATILLVHTSRLSPAGLERMAERAEINLSAVFSEPLPRLLIGFGATERVGSGVTVNGADDGQPKIKVANMHLTMIRQFGIIGWGLMLWIFGAALGVMYRAQRAIKDRHLRLTIWAIFSSLCGLLISMCGFNAFYSPSIQVFTWGLIGVAVAIVVHMNGRKNGFSVVYRFGIHGD